MRPEKAGVPYCREPNTGVVKTLLLAMCSQVLESQATMAPATSASSSPDTISVDHGTPGTQGVMEPMDTDTQEAGRTRADGRAGGRKKTQPDGKPQVDGRTPGDGTRASRRTQYDGKAQEDIATQESERPQSDRSSQKGSVTQ